MEDIIHAVHGVLHRLEIPDVAYVKADLLGSLRHFCLELMPHVVLLLLIAGEDADLADVGI